VRDADDSDVSAGVRSVESTHAFRTIDCEDCAMAGTNACDDCVVSFIVSREPGDAVVVDAVEERALRTLSESGLVPPVRHRSKRAG
jgi:hypothetical protein